MAVQWQGIDELAGADMRQQTGGGLGARQRGGGCRGGDRGQVAAGAGIGQPDLLFDIDLGRLDLVALAALFADDLLAGPAGTLLLRLRQVDDHRLAGQVGRRATAAPLDAGRLRDEDGFGIVGRLGLHREGLIEQRELVGVEALGLGAVALQKQIADLLLQQAHRLAQRLEMTVQIGNFRCVFGGGFVELNCGGFHAPYFTKNHF